MKSSWMNSLAATNNYTLPGAKTAMEPVDASWKHMIEVLVERPDVNRLGPLHRCPSGSVNFSF